MASHRIVGIDFDHMHMADLLRLVRDNADAEIVGVWHSDTDKPKQILRELELPESLIFGDLQKCLTTTDANAALLCSSTARHRMCVEQLAAAGIDVLMEKPFASNLEDADAMINACLEHGTRLAINWPLAWYPTHRTAKRLIDDGAIGSVTNIQYYDGNRGPIHHQLDTQPATERELLNEKQSSWFYKRDADGGSLLDYLGYGTTLATWFNGGQVPVEVTAVIDRPSGLEVDEHSVTVASYESGLYRFETRWGTFTDPWVDQPQPKCGFVICGTDGTIASYDFEDSVRIQDRNNPQGYDVENDPMLAPHDEPVNHFLHCCRTGEPFHGPSNVDISRIGQQIVDAAYESAQTKRAVSIKRIVSPLDARLARNRQSRYSHCRD